MHQFSRRTLLSAALGVVALGALTSCRTDPGVPVDPAPWPDAGAVRKRVDEAVATAGSDRLSQLTVRPGGLVSVDLVSADGSTVVRQAFFSDAWQAPETRPPDGDVPSWMPAASVPIEGMLRTATLGTAPLYVSLWVDALGEPRIRVQFDPDPDERGAGTDGAALDPLLDLSTAEGVRAAIDEIGHTDVVRVHFDSASGALEVVRADGGRTVASRRAPRWGPWATSVDPVPVPVDRTFDADTIDVGAVLTNLEGIGARAGLDGTVIRWLVERPPQGGDPLASYVLDDPAGSRVWTGPDGDVMGVAGATCTPGTDWCAR